MNTRRHLGRRLVLGALVAGAVGAVAGSAVAFWTSEGGGAGTATAGAAGGSPILLVETVTAGSPTSVLAPGRSADLVLQVTNPNPVDVRITAVAQHGPVAVVGGGADCTAVNAGVALTDLSTLSITVRASTSVVVHVPNGVAMGLGAPDACQGRRFEVPVLVTVQG